MKTWLRLLLVAMTVGGGITGIALSLDFISGLKTASQVLIALTFLVLFSFVTAAGLLFVHNPSRTTPVLVALVLQIPWVSCPVLVYQFATMMHATITLGTPADADRFGVHLGWNLLFGTNYQFRVGAYRDMPTTLGVNVVALFLFIPLLQSTRSSKVKPLPEAPIPSDSVAVEQPLESNSD